MLSGSDEMNIRLWKARASEKMGTLKPRERAAIEYAEKLKEKYATHPEVRYFTLASLFFKHVLVHVVIIFHLTKMKCLQCLKWKDVLSTTTN